MNSSNVEIPIPPVAAVRRKVRPDPRAFAHFPEGSTCPICGTNDDGKTVLVQIAGTAKGGLAECKPMHLACAVVKQWDEGTGIALTWPNAPVRPRTITLSENVRQESPVGFMVFSHEDMDADYMTFGEERDARDYAMEQEEKANAPEDSWPIYALWASDWPNVALCHGDEPPGASASPKIVNGSSPLASASGSDASKSQ